MVPPSPSAFFRGLTHLLPSAPLLFPPEPPPRFSPRPPPLQLWRPGVLSQAALDLAFPPPRRDGAGSADLEQKMLSAFLVTRANESARCSSVGASRDPAAGGPASPAASTAAAAAAAMARPEGGGKGLTRSASTAAAAADVLRAEEDANSLEKLAAFVAEGDGALWRSDWPEEDRAAFRKGVFAFRRDFHRVRAAFLPHKAYGDVVEYFYRWEPGRGVHWEVEDQVCLVLRSMNEIVTVGCCRRPRKAQ